MHHGLLVNDTSVATKITNYITLHVSRCGGVHAPRPPRPPPQGASFEGDGDDG